MNAKQTKFWTAAPAALALLAAAAGCEEPGAGSPVAVVGTSSSATSTASASPAAGTQTLALDAVTSKLTFVAAKVSMKHEGGFAAFTGAIDLVPDRPEASRIRIAIDTSSVWTDTPMLTGHVKSPDFFDVEKFPSATFTSTTLAAPVAAGGDWTITGDLNLHGVTKSISFPAKVTIDASAVRATSEFTINRKDFGIVYPGAPDDLISDAVLIRLDVRAPRPPPS